MSALYIPRASAMHFPITRLISQAPYTNTRNPPSEKCQSPGCPCHNLHSAENELLGHRRTRQVRIKQDAATHSSVQVNLTLDTQKGDTLQEIRQPNPPFLQERGAEFILTSKNQPGLPTKFPGVGEGDVGRSSQKRLFGGNGGIAPPAWGNVIRSFCRRSSNSEYLCNPQHQRTFPIEKSQSGTIDLFRITMDPPFGAVSTTTKDPRTSHEVSNPQNNLCFIERRRGGVTNIKSLNLAIPHHEIPNIGQHAAHEHIIFNRDALGPNGTALVGRFLGVVLQGDGRRFGIFDRRVGFVAAVGPVGGDQGWGWFGAGGVMVLERRFGFRALHPLGFVCESSSLNLLEFW